MFLLPLISTKYLFVTQFDLVKLYVFTDRVTWNSDRRVKKYIFLHVPLVKFSLDKLVTRVSRSMMTTHLKQHKNSIKLVFTWGVFLRVCSSPGKWTWRQSLHLCTSTWWWRAADDEGTSRSASYWGQPGTIRDLQEVTEECELRLPWIHLECWGLRFQIPCSAVSEGSIVLRLPIHHQLWRSCSQGIHLPLRTWTISEKVRRCLNERCPLGSLRKT